MVGWNYRMTEMQSAIGLMELERMDNWNMPIDTEERRNGWFVLAFSLDVDNMKCNIKEFVDAADAEGAMVWKVFWPQCHVEGAFRKHNAFGKSGFPFKSKEYTDASSADYTNVDVPNA